MNDWSAPIVAILGAGGGAILLKLGERLIDSLSGQGKKRRDEVDRAWVRADREASTRRRWQEHGAHLRRILIAAPCVDAATIPAEPTDKDVSA